MIKEKTSKEICQTANIRNNFTSKNKRVIFLYNLTLTFLSF